MSSRLFNPHLVPKPPRDDSPLMRRLFESGRTVDIEVGCGVGYHPIQYALSHPERYLVAIERTSEKFSKFARRLEAHPAINNILPVHADAVNWVSHHVLEASVSRYFILYPNPYPKAKHSNLRFGRMLFMAHVFDSLVPGGTLTLATNERHYFDEAKKHLVQDFGFAVVQSGAIDPKDFVPRSHFEKKYLKSGQTCFNLVLKKP